MNDSKSKKIASEKKVTNKASQKQIIENKLLIFELEAIVTDNFAKSMLALADVEENRALLLRNFTSSFMGNRSLALDNEEDLHRNRILMIDALKPENDIQEDFKGTLTNSTSLDQIEYRIAINETLSKITERLSTVNSTLKDINELIMSSNENVVSNVDDMISENASWIDGQLEKMKKSATEKNNITTAQSNSTRIGKLKDKSMSHSEKIKGFLGQVEKETSEILEIGSEIADRKSRIMAAREKVAANQKRSAEFLKKRK